MTYFYVGRFTEGISGANDDDDNNGETDKEEPLSLASNLIGDDVIQLEDNNLNDLIDEEEYDQYTSQSQGVIIQRKQPSPSD